MSSSSGGAFLRSSSRKVSLKLTLIFGRIWLSATSSGSTTSGTMPAISAAKSRFAGAAMLSVVRCSGALFDRSSNAGL